LAAAAALLDSVAAAVVVVLQEAAVPALRVLVLLEPAVLALRVLVLLEPVVLALPVLVPQRVVAQVRPQQQLLHLLRLLLPQVVVESEVTLRLQGRQSSSAAMARSSPSTVQLTYERAPSTRSRPKGRTCLSACRNWMPVRG